MVAKPKKRRNRSSSKERRRAIRALLKRHDQCCFWCGRNVYLHVWESADNRATTDHLFERDNPKRAEVQGERRRVLACYRCNNDRSNLPLEIRAWMADQAMWSLEDLSRL